MTRQSGVIPYRLERDGLKILLITSRETGRWVIPKGNIGGGRNSREAAELEAYEEAGVQGLTAQMPIGFYTYGKVMPDKTVKPTVVEVFSMEVTSSAKKWPERKERKVRWVTPANASRLVHEPGLAELFLQLAGRFDAGSFSY